MTIISCYFLQKARNDTAIQIVLCLQYITTKLTCVAVRECPDFRRPWLYPQSTNICNHYVSKWQF
ncbi:hypothetical protein DJ39_3357 [Yersinia ruckeri ATCC 29473]|uniref:Uncharacterized protein n=1 Tax=Yersinia ruckeri TaxID=29486 RepID=A0A380S9B8_YERRU|nr:hypothetical protein DJ39_3357 [Yersinia ruckeri ATCC 29473]CNI48007.1 Uncharacterised protein [Yersinia ruckeri]SUQ37539.1 Uncharacterised protein [Yersinia ruckeri]SUQ37667.1 Uncharacterised protein [Yersinia ruckeri]